MLSLKNSLAVLKKTKALLEGHFVLSSGLHSPHYVQCAKLLSLPNVSNKFNPSNLINLIPGSRIGIGGPEMISISCPLFERAFESSFTKIPWPPEKGALL